MNLCNNILGVPKGLTFLYNEVFPYGSITLPYGNRSRGWALVVAVASNATSNYYCGKLSLLGSEDNSSLSVVDLGTWSVNYSPDKLTYTKVSNGIQLNNGFPEWVMVWHLGR